MTKLNFGIQYGKETEVGIPNLVTNSFKTAEPTYKNYLSDMLLIFIKKYTHRLSIIFKKTRQSQTFGPFVLFCHETRALAVGSEAPTSCCLRKTDGLTPSPRSL